MYIFLFLFPLVRQVALNISPTFFPSLSHLYEGTRKLRKTCADTVSHLTESVPSLTASEKWPPAQRIDVQAADRRSFILYIYFIYPYENRFFSWTLKNP